MSLFDGFVDDYEDACAKGLRLSGEPREFFARQRVDRTQRFCSGLPSIGTVVDFGCGLGDTMPHLREAFPGARIVGVDSSKAALEAARRRHADPLLTFVTGGEELRSAFADVVYSNGTFHHIDRADRLAHVCAIVEFMKPGGRFVFWENNPWNPGTRLVMKRIPFDRNAQMLSSREAAAMLTAGGLRVRAVSFHFYFPAWLQSLRRFEPRLEQVPLGAQFCVIADKDSEG